MSTAVLVVSDQPEAAELIITALHDSGYAASAAGEPDEAWEIIQEQGPGAVLIDLAKAPDEGRKLCGRIRSGPATSAIVVALLSGTVRSRPDDSQADWVVVKPVEVFSIARAVDHLLGAAA